MSQIVYHVSEKLMKEMEQYYKNYLIAVPQGALFRAKTSQATITAYKSGKVLFQGKSPHEEANKWNEMTLHKVPNKQVSNQTTVYMPPNTLFHSAHIGSDEAGTGDYFGPITVAAVYVNHEHIPLLNKIGVQDSKNLNDHVIKKIAKEMVALNIPYSLLVLRNEKYNQLQKQGWTQGKMKAMLHHHAIKKLLQTLDHAPIEGIIIDQFCEPNIYKKHLASEKQQMAENTYFMTKAESYSIAVAAGSILARTKFLQEMDKLSRKLGVQLPKGASHTVDQVIANIISTHGKETLTSYGKVHFANSKKAEKYL